MDHVATLKKWLPQYEVRNVTIYGTVSTFRNIHVVLSDRNVLTLSSRQIALATTKALLMDELRMSIDFRVRVAERYRQAGSLLVLAALSAALDEAEETNDI